VDRMVAEFHSRRDLIVSELNQIPGISCQVPRGAFYVFPRVSELGLPASELQERLLREAGVAALPGTSFGSHGEGYLRLSYANSAENLRAAAAAIGDLVAAL
jgi:aspartate aminotransferase